MPLATHPPWLYFFLCNFRAFRGTHEILLSRSGRKSLHSHAWRDSYLCPFFYQNTPIAVALHVRHWPSTSTCRHLDVSLRIRLQNIDSTLKAACRTRLACRKRSVTCHK